MAAIINTEEFVSEVAARASESFRNIRRNAALARRHRVARPKRGRPTMADLRPLMVPDPSNPGFLHIPAHVEIPRSPSPELWQFANASSEYNDRLLSDYNLMVQGKNQRYAVLRGLTLRDKNWPRSEIESEMPQRTIRSDSEIGWQEV